MKISVGLHGSQNIADEVHVHAENPPEVQFS